MRKMILSAVAILAVTSLASAAVITVQPLVLNPGETGTLDVVISGGEQITAVDLLLVIGDGGANIGGTDVAPPLPAFVGGNLGAIWVGTGAVNQYYNLDVGSGPEPLIAGNAALPNVATPASANGVLFSFAVQANEALEVPVTVSVNLDNTRLNFGSLAYTAVDGTVTVIPEPAAIALLGLGGLFLRRRHA